MKPITPDEAFAQFPEENQVSDVVELQDLIERLQKIKEELCQEK